MCYVIIFRRVARMKMHAPIKFMHEHYNADWCLLFACTVKHSKLKRILINGGFSRIYPTAFRALWLGVIKPRSFKWPAVFMREGQELGLFSGLLRILNNEYRFLDIIFSSIQFLESRFHSSVYKHINSTNVLCLV